MYDYSRQIYELLQQYLPSISSKLDNLEKLAEISAKLSGFYPLLVVICVCLMIDRILKKGDMM